MSASTASLERGVRRAGVVSVIGHFVIFLFLIISPKLRLFPEPSAVQLPPAIRVDIVDLPDVLKRDLEKIDMTQPSTLDPEAVPKMKDDVTEKEQVEKEAFLKKNKKEESARRERIDKLREDLKRRMAVEKLRKAKGPTGLLIKGNQTSKGFSLTGEQLEGLDAYQSEIITQLKRQWQLPAWLLGKNFKAVVIVRLGKAGEVVRVDFQTRSGNDEFDRYVLRTVEAAAPFAPPPADLGDHFTRVGIGVNFP